MRVQIHLITALCLLASFAAQAEVRGFFTFGPGLVRFDAGEDNVKPINIYARLGAAFNRFVELGVEGGITLRSDEESGADFSVDTRLLYIQGNLPVSSAAQLYVLAGAARTQLSGTAVVEDESLILTGSAHDTDLAVGGGFRFMIRENYYFSVDYIRYFDGDEFDGAEGDFLTDAINIGVGGYF